MSDNFDRDLQSLCTERDDELQKKIDAMNKMPVNQNFKQRTNQIHALETNHQQSNASGLDLTDANLKAASNFEVNSSTKERVYQLDPDTEYDII